MAFTPAATTGDDILTDSAGNDSVDALAGNDRITVTRGFDNVNGGADRDRLIIDYSAATQGVSTDNNFLNGTLAGGYGGRIGQGNVAFIVDFSGIEDFTVTTGGSNDNITTGDGDDVINLGGGDDFANFGAGNDSGDGGSGTDGFSANMGSSTSAVSINLVTGISATFSNFEYLGTLTTGSGNDTIVTRGDVTAFETISTGAGADTITVARGFDNVAGGADRDRLIINYTGATQGVFTENNFLSGSLGGGYTGRIGQGNTNYIVDFSGIEDFTVTTGDTNDNILTGDGDDVISLGGGDDFANFGAGNDSGDGGTGTDGFSANLGSATAGVSINLVTGVSATFSNFEYLGTLTTGSGNDTIVTRSDVNVGEAINTGAGADTITVARGFDNVAAGSDRDRLIIDYSGATQDVRTENNALTGTLGSGYTGRIGQGNVNYTVDFSGVEDFTVTTGGTNDNILTGDGDDVINLGGGDDFANFGAGNDSGDGGTGTDGFSANLGSATAGVNINLVTGVSATFSNFEYLGTLTTGSGNDTIVTRADVAANEAIIAGAGADTVTVARGFDNVAGGADRDRLVIDYTGATQDVRTDNNVLGGTLAGGYTGRIWQGNGNYTVDFTGIEDFTVTTGGTNDNITTGDGDDVINLGGGDDFANFGAGNDSGDGGVGTDGFSANLSAATTAISINLATGVSASFSNFEYIGSLTTGSGNDTIVTRADVAGTEAINTGAGTDTITVARGFDNVNGGSDRDRLIIDYSGATQNVFTENNALSGTLAGGYTGRFGQGNVNYTVDFTGIEDFTITTGSTDDSIITGDGDDVIRVGAGNDGVNAAGGNDLVEGGDGSDTLNGGAGIDTLSYASAGPGGVTVNLSTTTQQNTLGAGLDTISGFENLVGSASADTLTGTTGANVISGGGGNDTIDGGAGDDTVNGDGGDDTILVSAGIDVVNGGADNDTVNISYSSQGIGFFNDAGGDVSFSNGVDTSVRITGVERIIIATGSGNDSITTLGGNDEIRTNGGNDTLNGGAGADLMVGGSGNDTYFVDDAGDVVTEVASEGTDEIRASLATYSLAALANVENLTGTSGAGQSLTGNGGANIITGAGGNDTLDGGAGVDTLIGGAGNDIYIVDVAGDVVTEASGAGTDEVRTSAASYTLTSNVENLTGTSGAGQALTGNGDANIITGLGGNDTLDGGAGVDTLIGGAGNDIYIVDVAGDVVTEASGEGTDEVRSSAASYTLTANVENLTGTSGAGQTLTGNGGVNVITGAGGNDMLDGGAGADTLIGGAGDDIYIVDDASDVVTEGGGEGTDEIRTTVANYQLAANVEKLTYVGTGATTVGGNAGNNTITGAGGNDVLNLSQGGNDTVNGGGGNDAIFFGAAFNQNDTVDGGAGTNDQLGLQGDYTGGNALTLSGANLTGVETVALLAGFDYNVTALDNLLTTGQRMTIFGAGLGAGDNLTFDGSAETSGSFLVYGGLGTDILTGGGGNDGFQFAAGRFNTATDVVNGGSGNDQVALNAFSGTLSGTNLISVETVVLLSGSNSILVADDWTLAGQSHTVFGSSLTQSVTINGSAESDGNLALYGGSAGDLLTGGAGNDMIIGGGGADTIRGGLGADMLRGDGGADTFVLGSAAESTSTSYDTLVGFDASVDKIDLPTTITAIDPALTVGTLSAGSFDSDLSAALAGLGANHAITFTADQGDLAGRVFLVADTNGIAGYQAGQDAVFEMVNPVQPIIDPTPFI